MSKLQHFQWRLYQHTYFVWLSTALNQADFAIVTAHNPKGRRLSHYANQLAHRRLIQQIKMMGYPYRELIGQSHDGGHQELSVALACSLAQGRAIAKQFQQNAIYWVTKDKLVLHGVLFDMPPQPLGSFSARCLSKS